MRLLLMLTLFYFPSVIAQNMNKEIAGQILIENNSEFYTFKAAVISKVPLDINLKYEFSFFRTDTISNENIKSSKEDYFLLKGYDKKILTSLTVSHTVEDKIILLLMIYDKDDRPLGSDRIVLEKGGKTKINLRKPQIRNSQDEALEQDGVFTQGILTKSTLTKNGRDFAKEFFTVCYNKQLKSPKNIAIKEVPGLRRNTLITVEVEGTLVWQFFAQPRKEFIKQMVDISFRRVIQHLQRLEKQKNQIITY